MLALDVVEDILLTQDVKDLLRWKSVCKSWYSLISSPLFVKRHLKFVHEKEDKDNKQLGNRRIHVGCCYFSYIEGSSNGLVCISSSVGNYQICLNNPSTRECRILQEPIILPNSNNGRNARSYGFGYDSSADDYKLVLAVDQGHHDGTLVQILSLKSNVWKLFGHVNYRFYDRNPGILFNGALHWFWFDANDSDKNIIVCFDLTKEEFREIPQPEDPTYELNRYNPILGILEDHLCIYNFPSMHPSVMWVMKNYNVKQSWELLPTNWAMKERLQCMEKDWRVPPKTPSYFCSDKKLMYLTCLSAPMFLQTLVSPYVNDNERPSVAKNNKRTVKSTMHKVGFAYAAKNKEIDDSRSREREERRRERGTKTIQSVNSRLRRDSRVGWFYWINCYRGLNPCA